MTRAESKDIALGMLFNHQTYLCPVHGFVTGEEVLEIEQDYGDLSHFCKLETAPNKDCLVEAHYVGHRDTPSSAPRKLKR